MKLPENKIPMEKWLALSESEQEFLSKIGFSPVEPKQGKTKTPSDKSTKCTAADPYTVSIHYICKLCNKKHSTHMVMELNDQKNCLVSRKLSIDEFQDEKYSSYKSQVCVQRLATCPNCRFELDLLTKDELIIKVISQANLNARMAENEYNNKKHVYEPTSNLDMFNNLRGKATARDSDEKFDFGVPVKRGRKQDEEEDELCDGDGIAIASTDTEPSYEAPSAPSVDRGFQETDADLEDYE